MVIRLPPAACRFIKKTYNFQQIDRENDRASLQHTSRTNVEDDDCAMRAATFA
jgi:hypothetical protein